MFDVKVDCMVNIHIFFSYIGATQSWPSDEDYYRFPSVSGKSNRTSKVSTYKARLSWIFFLTMKHPNEYRHSSFFGRERVLFSFSCLVLVPKFTRHGTTMGHGWPGCA